jgi:radical SAM protein with 4Fe4S-binding SPASM domain
MAYRDRIDGNRDIPDPRMIAWNVSTRCNLSCAHCYLPEADLRHPQTDWEGVRPILESIISLSPDAVFLAGGEPLMYSNTYRIVGLLVDSEIDVFVNTNGPLLNPRRCQRLRDSGAAGVIIGVDGVDALTYEAIRGTGMFPRMVTGLRTAQDHGLNVEVDFTLNRVNQHQITHLPAWGDDMNLQRITIKRYVPRLDAPADAALRLTPDLLRAAYCKLLREVPNLTTRSGCRIFAHDPLMIVAKAELGLLREVDVLREDCNAGAYRRGWVGVDARGYVSPCPVMTELRLDPRGHPWMELLNSPQFIEVRDTLSQTCRACTHVAYCRGGCRATKLRLNLTLTDPDPCCWLAQQPEAVTRSVLLPDGC